ncbi:HNH endonuclease signature motif containing protein [Ancylobacter sp.]|uniref:HNH endonuclease signature motif containing protein n=1 Tax=Ancylobacter sp. TaxID=1872567 RepID=UPI003C7A9E87
MTGFKRRPDTPRGVERQLRREAGFGCAKCGHPYIEYHHIVPWRERQHFEPEHMMALCGNCHPAVANLRLDRQYAIKHNPSNIRSGMVRGALVYDQTELVFKVGGAYFENTPTILAFYGVPIISAKIVDGEVKVSIQLYDEKFFRIFEVVDNEITFRIDDFWDFEYRHNYAVVRSAPRRVALEMDFRGSEAVINGKFNLLGTEVKISSDHINIETGIISGGRIVDCGTGIAIGHGRIIPPHYAQRFPGATFQR